ncbi:MAG TPA: TerC family protein [Trueperaceae bacterium]
MEVPLIFWIGFLVFVLAMLALDLGVFNRKEHVISVGEAARWVAFWVSLGLLFNAGLYFLAGPQVGIEFLTGYLIEYSLSVDNIFVFVLLFSAFSVPARYQHRVLFWGILGALLMRGAMIFLGVALIENFHWIIYFFGAFLVFAGLRLLFKGDDDELIDVQRNPILRLIRRFIPITERYHGSRFFIRNGGQLAATPLLLVLVLIEATDVVFAVDSIPAIFAITQEPFIVFTSNIFAILGLRSLYFLLAGIIDRFVYLEYGLAVILSYVGVKMLVSAFWHPPTWMSLAVIVAVLAVSIGASLMSKKRKHIPEGSAMKTEAHHE